MHEVLVEVVGADRLPKAGSKIKKRVPWEQEEEAATSRAGLTKPTRLCASSELPAEWKERKKRSWTS